MSRRPSESPSLTSARASLFRHSFILCCIISFRPLPISENVCSMFAHYCKNTNKQTSSNHGKSSQMAVKKNDARKCCSWWLRYQAFHISRSMVKDGYAGWSPSKSTGGSPSKSTCWSHSKSTGWSTSKSTGWISKSTGWNSKSTGWNP